MRLWQDDGVRVRGAAHAEVSARVKAERRGEEREKKEERGKREERRGMRIAWQLVRRSSAGR